MIKLLFIVFIATRFFHPYQALWIWGDFAKHLGLARGWRNRLYNKNYYDLHPPLYSWLIRLFAKVMPDHIAGVVVSELASVGTFWFSCKLFVFLGLSGVYLYIALGYLILNSTLATFAYTPFRYSLFCFFFTGALYFIVSGASTMPLISQEMLFLAAFSVQMMLAIVFSAFAFLTADILPFPLLLAFLLYGHWLSGLVVVVIYALTVLYPKFRIYSTHEYYPSCIEGKLERVRPFGLKQLISPFYFPATQEIFGKMQFSVVLRDVPRKFFQTIAVSELAQAGFANWVMVWLMVMGVMG